MHLILGLHRRDQENLSRERARSSNNFPLVFTVSRETSEEQRGWGWERREERRERVSGQRPTLVVWLAGQPASRQSNCASASSKRCTCANLLIPFILPASSPFLFCVPSHCWHWLRKYLTKRKPVSRTARSQLITSLSFALTSQPHSPLFSPLSLSFLYPSLLQQAFLATCLLFEWLGAHLFCEWLISLCAIVKKSRVDARSFTGEILNFCSREDRGESSSSFNLQACKQEAS